MPLARLLAVAMLVSWCAGRLCAQSQGNDNSAVAPFQATVSSVSSNNNVSSNNQGADLFQLDPTLQVWFTTLRGVVTNVAGGNHADDYAHPSTGHLIRIPVDLNKFTSESQSPFDVTCYAIRSYLVVRDSPDSDLTHRDGSTTCVPAARVRMYSTTYQER